jgi:hypothetical protein
VFQATSSMMSPAQRLMQAQMLQKAAMKQQVAAPAMHAPQANKFAGAPVLAAAAGMDTFVASARNSLGSKPPMGNVAFVAEQQAGVFARLNHYIQNLFK